MRELGSRSRAGCKDGLYKCFSGGSIIFGGVNMSERRKCPECDSVKIAQILYGLPAFDEKLEQDLEAGKVVLGGCNVTGEDPSWHCNDCEFEWRNNDSR